MRTLPGAVTAAVLLGLLVLPAAGPARGQGVESAGMITEVRIGKGRVELKPAGSADWRPARPFQALRPGDVLRASNDGSAIVLLTGGRGSVKVEAPSSPYTVAGVASSGKAEKARALVESGLGFLAQGAKEPPRASLSVRGALARPPVVLSPRRGGILPGPLVIEWLGSRLTRYTVRVSGPAGVVLERQGVPGTRLAYPSDAAPLVPGTRYTIEVLTDGAAAEHAEFEVLDAPAATAARRGLAEMEAALGPGVPANTVTSLRAALLARQGLLHDARQLVVGAIARDPDEPALHLLLGNLYAEAGLPEQAAAELEEARFLLSPGD